MRVTIQPRDKAGLAGSVFILGERGEDISCTVGVEGGSVAIPGRNDRNGVFVASANGSRRFADKQRVSVSSPLPEPSLNASPVRVGADPLCSALLRQFSVMVMTNHCR